MANYAAMGTMRDTTDDDNDDKDDTKRKSRNLSEKKRRDQFNMLVNELGSMVSTNTRKMDKSTVLKSTILFLKNHNEIAVRSRVHEIQEDWKPSFLSNEEFTHLILEALDGFIMIFSSNGRIYYASESVTSLLGYLPSELANSTIYEITYQDDQSLLYNVLLNPICQDDRISPAKDENKVSFTCHIKRGSLDSREEPIYERVHFVGYFRSDSDLDNLIPSSRYSTASGNDTKQVFVGTGRLHTPQLIRNMSLIDVNKSEFVSKHSLEWKFLFLDQRASPIIGYLPFEVLGTSGYDYYHVDDLDEVVTCHESLMRKGEGTSCFYRFLTKGQQWIWLQTRFYIDYNQWNSKPEFIVCTHNVVNYTEVLKQKKKTDVAEQSMPPSPPSNWSPKSSKRTVSRHIYHKAESDTSASIGSQSSRMSTSTAHSGKIKAKPIEEQCVNYNQPCYSEPILVPSASFLKPTTPGVAIPVAPAMMVNQQSLVMTPVQNQIQDELQRKHEELQQLIVHQQEELRRVSEQLLIARYGILSPLINVGVPYTVNSRCDVSQENARTETGTVPIPVTVPVSIVPVDSFSTVIPVTPVVSTVNSSMFVQPRMIPPIIHRDSHIQHDQLQDPSQMPFQICQLPEVMYNNNGSAGHQRPS